VLAVIAYHLNTRFAPGGFLCVTVFFVLSGYLITDMLTAEWAQHRKIDLKSFWIRRIRRLFPAMLAMIVAVIAWFALTDPGQLQLLRKEAVAAVLYVSNWWFIYHKVPYFEQFAAPDPFLHTWSLGIEEQFYLLWPLIVLFGMSRFRSRGRLTLMALSVAAVSMLVMAWLHQPGQDTSRIYYGTDTRAFSLLIGAALAFVWPSRTISQRVSALGGKLLDAGGALALGGILWAVWQWDEFKDWIYPGGMVALSLLSAVVVMAVAPSRSMLGSVLGWKPVAWIGRRSYGMYIWHYPLIVLAAPADYSGAGGAVQALIVLAACLTAGALSWTFIEQPMLQGVKRNLLKRTGRFAIALTGAFAIIMAQGSGLLEKGKAAFEAASSETSASETTRRDGVNEPIAGTGELIEHREVAVFSVASELLNQEGLTASSGSNTAAAPVKPAVGDASRTNAPPSPQDEADRANGGVTVIGDSIILGVEPYLKPLIPNVRIDGKVGRQFSELAGLVRKLQESNELQNTVVIELGTNGLVTEKQLSSVMEALGNRRVYMINVRVSQPWQDAVNEALDEAAEKYANIKVLDWYGQSAKRTSFFGADGVHLTATGAQYYAEMIRNRLFPNSDR
jgi:peptidoglycan/LPS O-acetylase OafA/YrhL